MTDHPTCSTCKHFDLDYGHDGYQRYGKCRFRFPPSVMIAPAMVWASDGCSLHSPADDEAMKSRRECWPPDILI